MDITIKHVIDFSISIVVFRFFEFEFIFGNSSDGFVSSSYFLLNTYNQDAEHPLFFLFCNILWNNKYYSFTVGLANILLKS